MTSDSEEEDFVTFGTPLEPLEEDAIPKKRAVTIEDQVAKDKHGRRRFHGAFTGGFSAGFFNTVGSLEGWKPSQFKSSRSSKAQGQFQKAEDFMDEEDMDEFGIAPKMLRPTGDYNRTNEGPSRKRPQAQFSDGPIPGIPVLNTLEPVKETIGIKLLMQMGWKPGQGVGPRLSRKEKSTAKKLQKKNKLYGCALPNQEERLVVEAKISDDSEEDHELYSDVTFAPDDFESFLVKPKNDSFGLGYSGLDRRPVLSSHVDLFGPVGGSALVMQDKKKKVNIRGQAFGVGAFEGEDEDIYAKEDMSQYDFALDTPQMLAEKRKQGRNSRAALPPTSGDILEGFVLFTTPTVRKTYPPPPLPQGFTPTHQTRESRFSAPGESQSHVKATRLTASERAVLVDEPSKTKVREEPPSSSTVTVERTVSGTFRPFVADPEKQERYEKYLTLRKLDQSDKLKSLQPLTMTEWERERERGEFEQASRLYQPLSAAFSERFVSASQPDSATDATAPVERTANETADDELRSAAKMKMFGKLTRRVSEWHPHSTLCKRFNIPQPGCSSGSLQPKPRRPKFSVFNFLDAAPFNAPSTSRELESEVPPLSSDVTMADKAKSTDVTTGSDVPNTPDAVKSTISEHKKVDKDKMEQLVESTNKMDLYKAIFLSSSEDEDEDKESLTTTKPSDQPSAKDLNILRNTSPPRGIFANLDKIHRQERQSTKPEECLPNEHKKVSPSRETFSNLYFDKKNEQHENTTIPPISEVPITTTAENNEQSTKKPEETNIEVSAIYGPSLPKSLVAPQPQKIVNITVYSDSSDSEEDWVEMNDSQDSDKSCKPSSKKKHSKKSHRKSKRHKEKKHKHKKKRK